MASRKPSLDHYFRQLDMNCLIEILHFQFQVDRRSMSGENLCWFQNILPEIFFSRKIKLKPALARWDWDEQMHYDSGFSKSWYVGVEEAICIDMGTRYTRYDILNQDHQNHRSTQRELQQQKAEKKEIVKKFETTFQEIRKKLGPSLKWTVLGQSGRSRGVKLNGHEMMMALKWTVCESGRSAKVDDLRKWTILKSKG